MCYMSLKRAPRSFKTLGQIWHEHSAVSGWAPKSFIANNLPQIVYLFGSISLFYHNSFTWSSQLLIMPSNVLLSFMYTYIVARTSSDAIIAHCPSTYWSTLIHIIIITIIWLSCCDRPFCRPAAWSALNNLFYTPTANCLAGSVISFTDWWRCRVFSPD